MRIGNNVRIQKIERTARAKTDRYGEHQLDCVALDVHGRLEENQRTVIDIDGNHILIDGDLIISGTHRVLPEDIITLEDMEFNTYRIVRVQSPINPSGKRVFTNCMVARIRRQ